MIDCKNTPKEGMAIVTDPFKEPAAAVTPQ